MLIVYTAITGRSPDFLETPAIPPDPRGRSVKFVVFTDGSPTHCPPWEWRPLVWAHDSDPGRSARFHKIRPEMLFGADEAAYTLWHDATHTLRVNPWELVDRYLSKGKTLATFRHPQRCCVYAERDACLRFKKDQPEVMAAQLDRYHAAGYPTGRGLYETSVLLRDHRSLVNREVSEAWWRELVAGSRRDQLSLPYALWRCCADERVAILPGDRVRSPFFTFSPH